MMRAPEEVGPREICAIGDDREHIGFAEICVPQIGLAHDGAIEICAGEIGSRHARAAEIGGEQIGALEIDAGEIESGQVLAGQIWAVIGSTRGDQRQHLVSVHLGRGGLGRQEDADRAGKQQQSQDTGCARNFRLGELGENQQQER